ncbi:MAG: exonuclease domain-containing protein, partial [Bowdeniella nasicola]|nr:exonuclease domain-containing protein [Bowdeniella nasicola]
MESLLQAIPGRRMQLDEQFSASTPQTPPNAHVQLALDDFGTPLSDVTFVVVDLETTGGRACAGNITEIGAVKLRGGEELGHFSTLVRPRQPVPPAIAQLTGITNAMVHSAPRIGEVFASFLAFAGLEHGNVLVAHNARFDLSFLRATAKELGYPFPVSQVVDTLMLA